MVEGGIGVGARCRALRLSVRLWFTPDVSTGRQDEDSFAPSELELFLIR